MGDKNTARFDSDKGHSWDTVMDKSDEIFEALKDGGFSATDISHIGLRLTQSGSLAWLVECNGYVKSGNGEGE